MRRNDKIRLNIEKLALGGRGLGFYEKIPFFVEDVVPGDEVEARITKLKKSFGEAKVVEFVKKSLERIEPRCKHFGECGGCTWQFLSYEKQLEWKEQQVRETLEHLGRLDPAVVQKMVGCEEPWFYRNKMEWSFDGSRAGFHVRGRWHDVVNVEECFLQSDESLKIFKAIRECAKDGELRSVYVREGKRTGEMMVVFLTYDQPLRGDFVELLKTFPRVVSAAHVRTGMKGGPKEKIIYGKDFYREEMHVGGRVFKFHVRPQAFFQPNTLMAEKIYEQVLAFVEPSGEDRVLDLFCGIGTIGMTIAPHVREVVGIELEESAIVSARENAQLQKLENITFYGGAVEKILPNLKHKPSIVVVDPPRAGVFVDALKNIVELRPQKIVYVSCNPATFARDARILVDHGYRLCIVQPFDQFPQTGHIELVSLFTNP